MEKLIFFGDSNVYGFGLGGKWDEDWSNGPHPLGWANVLCTIRNATGRNLSKPGSSNLEIMWTMLNTKIEPDEKIIVQWTYWNRDCILDNEVIQIRPEIIQLDKKKYSEDYYRVHTNIDMKRRNWLIINHALLWLTQQTNYFLMLGNTRGDIDEHPGRNTLEIIKKNYENDREIVELTDKLIKYFYSDCFCDYAQDGIHFGPESNIAWANILNKIIPK